LRELYCNQGLHQQIKPHFGLRNALGIQNKPNFQIKTGKKIPSCRRLPDGFLRTAAVWRLRGLAAGVGGRRRGSTAGGGRAASGRSSRPEAREMEEGRLVLAVWEAGLVDVGRRRGRRRPNPRRRRRTPGASQRRQRGAARGRTKNSESFS
jgi:hypothetical protein